MKTLKHLLLLCFLLLTSIPIHAQEAIGSPIYIAALLIDEPSADDMALMCEYYGFTEQSSTDDYRVFSRPDGTTLRFRVDGTEEHPLPTVEVTTKSSPKEIKGILNQAGFSSEHKNSSIYTRGTRIAQHYTTCTAKNGRLTFTKHIGSIPKPTPSRTPNTAQKHKLRKSSTNP